MNFASVFDTRVKRSYFRQISNYTTALGSESVSPFLRLAAEWTCPGRMLSPVKWKKGLLLGANHIGDILYCTGSLPYLQSGFPDCHWTWLAGTASAEILKGNPAIDSVVSSDGWKSGDFVSWARQEKFDGVICYDSGRYAPNLWKCLKAGIPNRVGYTHKGFSGWVTHPVGIRHPQPYPAYFRDFVQQLTATDLQAVSLRPRVYPEAENEAEVSGFLQQMECRGDESLVACFLTSRQPNGVWPAAHILRVLELAQQAHPGFTVVFCGTAGDRPVLEKARTAWQGKSFVMAGDLSLLGVVLLLQKCRAVVTTDSGPRHLSNAAGVPVYFVRNPWFSPIEAGVYCPETEYDGAPVTGQIAPELQKAWFEEVDLAAMASHLATRLGRISP